MMGSVQFVKNVCVKKCVEWNFRQIAQKKKMGDVSNHNLSKICDMCNVSKRHFNHANFVLNGRVKVCERYRAPSDPQPKGQHCFPLVVTFLTNCEFFVRSVKTTILSRQIVIRHIALRQIATHPT